MIYLLLFLEFFKIGLFTFGGGFAMIPLIKEVVLKYEWLTLEEFTNFIGVCESTPGPIAVNMATYIGSIQGGILGSLLATLGVVLPSFIIILLIATLLKKLIKNRYFQAFMNGVKPIISALILSTGLILLAKCIGYENIKTFNLNTISLICFGLIVLIYLIVTKVLKKKLSSIKIILISIILGIGISLLMEV